MNDTPLGQARPAQFGSLADAFKPAADLGEMLQRKPKRTKPEAAPTEEPGSDEKAPDGAESSITAEPTPEPEQPAKRDDPKLTKKAATNTRARKPAADPRERPAAAENADRGVSISLPRSLMQRLVKFKNAEGLSYPTILFDAIEASYDDLPELVRQTTVATGATSGRRLFDRPESVARRDAAQEPREQQIVRMTKANREILDQLTIECGATSRNALLTAAFDAYLPQ